MKNVLCSHPNCKLAATKKHPKGERGLCELHYGEVISVKSNTRLITLTCSDNSENKCDQ